MDHTPLPLLVETDWLEAHLQDSDLLILDATVYYLTDPETGTVRIVNGQADWDKAHIPGSTFVDLVREISDSTSPLRFAVPSAEQFAHAMSQHGVGPGKRVVIYDANHTMWATRVWWLLRVFGFEDAAILNGGWKKWTQEGRPVTSGKSQPAPAAFVAKVHPELIATKEEILANMAEGGACVMNALAADSHRQERIPGSSNVPAVALLDPDTGAYLPLDVLQQRFGAVDALSKDRVLVYCGAGIAATSNAFVLTLLGAPSVAVYDGSMQEWTADPVLAVDRD